MTTIGHVSEVADAGLASGLCKNLSQKFFCDETFSRCNVTQDEHGKVCQLNKRVFVYTSDIISYYSGTAAE